MANLFRAAPLSPVEKSEGWRRIRVGFAGLGGIVILLAIFSAMLSNLPILTTAPGQEGANTVDAPSEPMADFGVAPGVAEKPAAAK